MWSRTHSAKPLVDPSKLTFCIEHRLNLLLKGPHGVGKTTLVRQAFQEAGLNLLVFSGATMDPWVDLVGVPRPLPRPDGSTVLELVRRKELVDNEVDAIFIDEFNRAPAKVRNAAMELLQFGSINGEKLSRIRCVWAAINPDEQSGYDVERLDPAQLDRFHMTLEIPNRPCPRYFSKTYGSRGKAALEWWESQGSEAQALVSPRRLEYALMVAAAGGPVRNVLPSQSNVQSFLGLLEEGPLFDRLKDLLNKGDREQARAIIEDPLRGANALKHILDSKAACLFFLPLLPPERLQSLLYTPSVMDLVVKYSGNVPEFQAVIESLFIENSDQELLTRAKASARRNKVALSVPTQPTLVGHTEPISDKEMRELDPHGRFERP
jgi:hypothetical protein